ncbi:MAG: hypothetical protein ACJ8DC_10600 [Gemmatimonadales bacterium]
MSEHLWFRDMLGIDVGAPPLLESELRLGFLRRYAEDAALRLAALRSKDEAPTISPYPDVPTLLEGEAAGGGKRPLPGPGLHPTTERPG